MRVRAARVCALALALAAAWPPSARAEEPAAAPSPAPAGEAEPHGVLWWNDAGLLERIPLSKPTRARMDALYETYRAVLRAHPLPKARAAYFEALVKGDDARARRESDAWATGSAAVVHADAALKLGVLSLLSHEQREKLVAMSPRLVALAWAPRPAWFPPAAPHDAGGAATPGAGAAKAPAAP